MCDADEYFPQCAVCFDSYDEQDRVPIILNCGHSFCKSCLYSVYDKAKKCPTCRSDLGTRNDRKNYDLMKVTASIISLIQERTELESKYKNDMAKKEEEIEKLRGELTQAVKLNGGLTTSARFLRSKSDEIIKIQNVVKHSQDVPPKSKVITPTTVKNNVYIKNLPDNINNESLDQMFKVFGTVLSAKVERKEDGRSKGFGFVCYQHEDDAKKAIEKMHNSFVNGKKLYVALQQKKEDRAVILAQKHKSSTNSSDQPQVSSVQSIRRSNMSQNAGPTRITGPLPRNAQTSAQNNQPARTIVPPTQFSIPRYN